MGFYPGPTSERIRSSEGSTSAASRLRCPVTTSLTAPPLLLYVTYKKTTHLARPSIQDVVVGLLPISPRAVTPRLTNVHHDGPSIGDQVRDTHFVNRVPGAQSREPARDGARSGAQQEGDLVQEPEAAPGRHDGSPVRADGLRSSGARPSPSRRPGAPSPPGQRRRVSESWSWLISSATAPILLGHRAHPQAARHLDSRPRGGLRWWWRPSWTPENLHQH